MAQGGMGLWGSRSVARRTGLTRRAAAARAKLASPHMPRAATAKRQPSQHLGIPRAGQGGMGHWGSRSVARRTRLARRATAARAKTARPRVPRAALAKRQPSQHLGTPRVAQGGMGLWGSRSVARRTRLARRAAAARAKIARPHVPRAAVVKRQPSQHLGTPRVAQGGMGLWGSRSVARRTRLARRAAPARAKDGRPRVPRAAVAKRQLSRHLNPSLSSRARRSSVVDRLV